MGKIAIFFAKGYEEIEALTVVDICRRAGLEIDMVSISDVKEGNGAHKIDVKMDKVLSEVKWDELDMMVLPGGMPGTKNLEACDELMKHLDDFYNNGKMVAAICAAPSIFGHRGYVNGKTACIYPGMEEHLNGANVSFEKAVTDGNVITGRGMGCAIAFSLEILKHFKGEDAAKEMAEKIVY